VNWFDRVFDDALKFWSAVGCHIKFRLSRTMRGLARLEREMYDSSMRAG